MTLDFINYYTDEIKHYVDVLITGEQEVKLGALVLDEFDNQMLLEKAKEVFYNIFPDKELTEIKFNGNTINNY